jgi:RND family efflux transporter MFP subunit
MGRFLDGDVNATIRPQVTGYLVKQNYREGDPVKKGQTLFEIDPRTFQAAVEQAAAARSKQQAMHDTAVANLARIKPLAEKNAVSQKDLDDATGSELSARAALDQATAALDTARLNLDFTRITSPINGIAGIAKAQIGDLLSPSATAELTTVSTVDPIKVYVNISEREYLKFSASKRTGQSRTSAPGDDPGRWQRLPQDRPVHPAQPAGRSDDGHVQGRWPVPQPGVAPAPGTVRQDTGHDRCAEGGAAGAPAGSCGSSGQVPRCGGRRRQQG